MATNQDDSKKGNKGTTSHNMKNELIVSRTGYTGEDGFKR